MSLDSLRKSNSLDKLLNAVKEDSAPQEKKSYKDDRLWKPELDKSGNGYAVIRFLPSCEGEDLPWAKLWSHAFQGPGGWYIENSLTTIGKSDPVGDLNRKLWNSGRDSDKEIARKQKRKLSYFSNIYVVRDSLHPENEGRVFLFKYGKKIYDKIVAAMQPEFEDEQPINPFDFWKGADFKLKIRKLDGFWNYDKSEFAPQGTLGDFSDSELEEVYSKTHSLVEFTADSNFKTYEDLEKRLGTVLAARKTVVDMETEEAEEELVPVAAAPVREEVKPKPSTDDESDTLSFFANLAESE